MSKDQTTIPTDAMVEAALDKFFDDAVGWRDVTDQQSMIADMRTTLTAALAVSGVPEVVEALQDMLSGWRYIRSVHGDLPGVGWDRAQQAAESAIARTALARVTEPQP
jgi:hypothetical protein